MSKITIETLKQGEVIQSKKSEALFTVISVDANTRRAELENQSTEVHVELSASTIERWYKYSEEQAEPTATPAKPKPAPAVRPKVKRAVRKPAAPVVRPAVVKQEIEADDKKEEVELTKKVIDAKPKSSNVLHLSTKLQERISKEFPSSTRRVTTEYISYRNKHNFVEISEAKTKVRIRVRTEGMNQRELDKLTKVYPKSFGWALDGLFNILTESDIETAMELISISFTSAL